MSFHEQIPVFLLMNREGIVKICVKRPLFTQFSAKTSEICVYRPVLHIFIEIPGLAGNDE